MADTDPTFLSEGLALELRDLARNQRRRPPQPPAVEHRRSGRPPLRAYLLQDLPSAGAVPCEASSPCERTMVQKVALIGVVTGGTFKLSFAPPAKSGQSQAAQTTSALQWNSTAAQVQKALQALSYIGSNNVNVTLGQIAAVPAQPATSTQLAVPAQPAMFPGLWLIEFVGPFESATNKPPTTSQIPLLTVTANNLTGGPSSISVVNEGFRDPGRRETANAIIPVGTPTPMRAGSVVGCVWMPGLGYVVMACECREFSTTVNQ